jgi:hypothetical protein
MEPQHGSAFLVLAVLTLCYLLLSCLPEPSTVNPKTDEDQKNAVARIKELNEGT